MKEATVKEKKNGKQGNRTDIQLFLADIRKGMTNKELAIEHPGLYLRHFRMIAQYKKDLVPEITPKYKAEDFCIPLLDVHHGALHFWGKSGTGKTQFALAHFKHPLLVRHLDDLQRLSDGPHDGVVFDDVSFIKVNLYLFI